MKSKPEYTVPSHGQIHMPSKLDELAEMLTNKINDVAAAARSDRNDFRSWNEEQGA